jgi:hypothetical protein
MDVPARFEVPLPSNNVSLYPIEQEIVLIYGRMSLIGLASAMLRTFRRDVDRAIWRLAFAAGVPISVARRFVMKDPYSGMAMGMAVGIGVGAAVGAAMDNVAIGVAIGIAIGAGLGGAFNAWRDR